MNTQEIRGRSEEADDSVVTHCPIRGHSPLCSKSQCRRESLDGYKSCKAEFGMSDEPFPTTKNEPSGPFLERKERK